MVTPIITRPKEDGNGYEVIAGQRRVRASRLNDVGEYIAETAMQEPPMEVNTVWDMLNEIEDENLYRALLTVDKRTLQIVLLKMQGYSLKEIAPMVDLSAGAVYARLDHLRKKLRKLL